MEGDKGIYRSIKDHAMDESEKTMMKLDIELPRADVAVHYPVYHAGDGEAAQTDGDGSCPRDSLGF